ncbi:MAG: DNA polymerase III subunit beta [Holosporaceae bacterium]|jgi:DNA polymerase-3 subunit beta|nr:DNA polymerase III subunit beta [Holosporaceae bacterium]
MRASVAKKDLLPAVMRAVSVADKRSVVPILSHVLLDFRESSLQLKATDLDHSLIEDVTAEVSTLGMVAVPAATLGDIVRKSSDAAMLEFSLTDKGNKLIVVAGKSKFELSTLDHKDFPEIAPLKGACNFCVKSADLNKLIIRTKISISPEESRHNLSGIFLQKEEDKLKAASTDGHRLSVSEIGIDIKESIQGMIISKKTVFEIKKLLDLFQEEDVIVAFSVNQIQFTLGNITFISKLVDGVFPDYKRVIPEVSDNFFVVKRTDFLEIVDRVSVISDDKIRSVKLELTKNNLACYVANSKVGSGRDEVEVIYTGQGWSAGFNASYLLDMAQTVHGESLKVYVKESLAPILILDESEPESLFVIMPMRI